MKVTIRSKLSLTKSSLIEWLPVFAGLILLYIPHYYQMFSTVWATDEQGHGAIIVMLVAWLFWRNRAVIDSCSSRSGDWLGWAFLFVGLSIYGLGASQSIPAITAISQIFVISGVVVILRGIASLKFVWIPLLFLLFTIPLPPSIIYSITLPLKLSVSWATDNILYWLGYPIARNGVILQLGQYKLLVADACAGLNTIFTLEALGFIYLHLVKHSSPARNIALAIAIIPISFIANTVRVVLLALITFYYGEEAGKGFLHDFAGMVLFLTALSLILLADWVLISIFPKKKNKTLSL